MSNNCYETDDTIIANEKKSSIKLSYDNKT